VMRNLLKIQVSDFRQGTGFNIRHTYEDQQNN
jgi:hypothetical protein